MMLLRRRIHTGARGCTFHYQKSMPRLPIPELEKTCDRWLKAVTPIMTDAEMVETKKAIEDFAKNEGKGRQAIFFFFFCFHPIL